MEALQDAVNSLADTVSKKTGVSIAVATKNKDTGTEMSEMTINTNVEPGSGSISATNKV
jgi:hypothetical protein